MTAGRKITVGVIYRNEGIDYKASLEMSRNVN